MTFETMRLDHVGIRVTDLDIAERFYAKLGLPAIRANLRPKPGRAAWFTRPVCASI